MWCTARGDQVSEKKRRSWALIRPRRCRLFCLCREPPAPAPSHSDELVNENVVGSSSKQEIRAPPEARTRAGPTGPPPGPASGVSPPDRLARVPPSSPAEPRAALSRSLKAGPLGWRVSSTRTQPCPCHRKSESPVVFSQNARKGPVVLRKVARIEVPTITGLARSKVPAGSRPFDSSPAPRSLRPGPLRLPRIRFCRPTRNQHTRLTHEEKNEQATTAPIAEAALPPEK